MSIPPTYQTVATAWKEGRLENTLERQKELAALHRGLQRERQKLSESLLRDFTNVKIFPDAEIDLALQSIQSLYDSLNFKSTLAGEERVRKGASQTRRLFAKGIALIVPTLSCPIYSTLAPLAASIAAGGAAVVVPIPTAASTFNILAGILREGIDPEAVVLVPDGSSEARLELAQKHFDIAVLQDFEASQSLTGALQRSHPAIHILQPGWGISAIFVDRSVPSLAAVASHILRATESPTLHTWTTPRLAFVDEFLVEELERLLERRLQGFVDSEEDVDSSSSLALSRQLRKSFPTCADDLKRRGSSRLITLRTNSPINPSDLYQAASIVAQQARNLLLVPVRSTDQGIDTFNKMNGRLFSQAIYVFAGGKEGQYLSQFVNSQQVLFNQIPLSSLVSVRPRSQNNHEHAAYQAEDFSENRPLLQAPLTEVDSSEARSSSSLQLKKIYQPQGGAMNFFDKGLLVSLFISVAMICSSTYFVTRGIRGLLR